MVVLSVILIPVFKNLISFWKHLLKIILDLYVFAASKQELLCGSIWETLFLFYFMPSFQSFANLAIENHPQLFKMITFSALLAIKGGPAKMYNV